MTEEFQPRNELEQYLADVHAGRLAADAFMQKLVSARVFMPVGEQDASKGVSPLALEAEDGTNVMILFTSPERARDFTGQLPGYEGGFLVEFKEALEKLAEGYGVSINPGWDIGIDLDYDMVRKLVAEIENQEKMKINVTRPKH